MEIRVYDAIDKVPQPAWDALCDGQATPFLRWHWLEALETSGCATGKSGWQPCHLTLWRRDELVAAAPAYIKEDSDGDFSRDWGWADAAMRARIPYYPKLVLTVPFTPCTGRRVLVRAGEDRAELTELLVGGARKVAEQAGLSSVHALFPLADEARQLEEFGLARRVSYQYHWRNDGYRSFDDFLARFGSKKRNQAKRERASVAQHGLGLRTLREPELRAEPKRWADAAYELHRSTVDKLMWGRRWINRAFYRRVVERMPENLELVVAERHEDGKLVAGAFNVASKTHLYGRYWGCFEEYRFLHFNVCMYHSIEECIRRGVQVFEGGAGGEHKIARGFEPAETFTAFRLADRRLDTAVRRHLAEERGAREEAVRRWREEHPRLGG
ncbi:MAG TPA: GNAT family N-acetyltransferase [Polyangia bacterium]